MTVKQIMNNLNKIIKENPEVENFEFIMDGANVYKEDFAIQLNLYSKFFNTINKDYINDDNSIIIELKENDEE